MDFKATLYDGSFHTVDSSEMAFKIAGSIAFKAACEKLKISLLEPIVTVSVSCPDEYMVLDEDFRVIQAKGRKYLAKTARTNGYQGFVGLPWFGHVMYPVQEAFCTGTSLAGSGSGDARTTKLFSGQLKAIDDDADDILSDLGLVVLNGEVMACCGPT